MKREIKQYLIERAADGDAEAFSEIYGLLKNSIYGFVLRMTNEAAVAEDITQEVFIFFIENTRKFDVSRGSLFSFLCGVARNKVFNYLKKSDRRMETADLETDAFENLPNDFGKSPLNILLGKECFARIERSVSELSPLQREVLLLREMEDLSYEEIAQITETDIGVVKSRLFRARRTLANELAPYINSEKEGNVYELH